MAFIDVTWAPPDATKAWTQQEISRSTNGIAGTYAVLDTVAAAAGIYTDESGSRTYFYRTRFYDPVSGVYDEYSNPVQGGYGVAYLSLDEARRQSKLQKDEYPDETLQELVDQATEFVDELTGRTWQGVATVTNEYYNSPGGNTLFLRHTDIVALTALAVDITGNGTFTTVTPSLVDVYSEGRLVLDINRHSSLEAGSFTKGYKTVRISYTYGIDGPTQSVKELTLYVMLNKIKTKKNLQELIDKKVEKLRWKGITTV